MEEVTKQYTNGSLTIVWKPALCIHSKRCWTRLPHVFDPRRRPWIDISQADAEAIKMQVNDCPSGALSLLLNNALSKNDEPGITGATTIEILPDGPLIVHGNLLIKYPGGAVEEKHNATAFCRCGASANKPYCDGSHVKAGFKDKEVSGG